MRPGWPHPEITRLSARPLPQAATYWRRPNASNRPGRSPRAIIDAPPGAVKFLPVTLLESIRGGEAAASRPWPTPMSTGPSSRPRNIRARWSGVRPCPSTTANRLHRSDRYVTRATFPPRTHDPSSSISAGGPRRPCPHPVPGQSGQRPCTCRPPPPALPRYTRPPFSPGLIRRGAVNGNPHQPRGGFSAARSDRSESPVPVRARHDHPSRRVRAQTSPPAPPALAHRGVIVHVVRHALMDSSSEPISL